MTGLKSVQWEDGQIKSIGFNNKPSMTAIFFFSVVLEQMSNLQMSSQVI